MVEVRCDECDELMELTETDSRSEWVAETYECSECNKIKIHKTTFNQIGLVVSDELYEL